MRGEHFELCSAGVALSGDTGREQHDVEREAGVAVQGVDDVGRQAVGGLGLTPDDAAAVEAGRQIRLRDSDHVGVGVIDDMARFAAGVVDAAEAEQAVVEVMNEVWTRGSVGLVRDAQLGGKGGGRGRLDVRIGQVVRSTGALRDAFVRPA